MPTISRFSPRPATYIVAQDGSGDFNGTTNTPIAAAITALGSGGGTVIVRRGTYTLADTISVPSNVQLIGEGRGNTILKLANSLTDKSVIYFNTTVTDVTIKDLTVDGNAANQSGTYGYGISSHADGSNRRILVQNCEIRFTQAIGIVLKGMYMTIDNCIAHDINIGGGGGGDGLALWGSNNTISNSKCYDMGVGGGGTNHFAVYSSDNSVQNVSIINCHAYFSGGATGACKGFNFEAFGRNVVCSGCSSYNVETAMNIMQTFGAPAGLVIEGFVARGFKTAITGGVSDVLIANSQFYTTLATGTVIAYSSANTSTNWNIINCMMETAGVGINLGTNVSKIKVINNWIKSAGIAINGVGAGDCEIRGNTFVNPTYVLICNNIDRVIFAENRIYATSSNAVLNLWNTAYKYWQIINNYVESATGSAFVLTGLSYSTVRGNFLKNATTGTAISLVGTGEHNMVINNICIDDRAGSAAQQKGIAIGSSQSTNMVSDNVCTGNTQAQIEDAGIDTSGSGNLTS